MMRIRPFHSAQEHVPTIDFRYEDGRMVEIIAPAYAHGVKPGVTARFKREWEGLDI